MRSQRFKRGWCDGGYVLERSNKMMSDRLNNAKLAHYARTTLITFILSSICLEFSGSAGSEAGLEDPRVELRTGDDTHKPVTSTEATAWDHALSQVGPSVFALGRRNFEGGPISLAGTAFLISREERLLATAAHVADQLLDSNSLVAIPNGGRFAYDVNRAWYHPSTLRRFSVGLYVISQDPRAGEIWDPTFDVAVLRLASGGPPLPVESDLASDKDLMNLDREPVGSLGFPSSGGDGGLVQGRPVAAEMRTGAITGRRSWPCNRPWLAGLKSHPGNQPLVRSSENLGPGSSGGPLFLRTGLVVAVRYGADSHYSEGITVNVLREILRSHKLISSFSVPVETREVATTVESERRLNNLRGLVGLVKHAEELSSRGQFKLAVDRASEAIRREPTYAWAYLRRGEAYLGYCQRAWASLQPDDKSKFAELSAQDISKSISLLCEWNLFPCVLQSYANLYMANAKRSDSLLRRNIEYLTGLIEDARRHGDNRNMATFVNCRAHCYKALGDFSNALGDFEEAVRLDPTERRWRLDRLHGGASRGQEADEREGHSYY